MSKNKGATGASSDPFGFLGALGSNKKLLGLIAGGIVVLWVIVANINITNQGNRRENALNAQYVSNQNVLSDCIVKIRETANVTQAQADEFEAIMVEVIKGRYEGETSAQPGSGALFSAITEDYPDLSGLNEAFERVYTVIVGCRTDYRLEQDRLLDMLREFDDWRNGSQTARWFAKKYPSDNLVARVGTGSDRGLAAYDRMYTIVQVQDSIESYETGVLEPENPFGDN